MSPLPTHMSIPGKVNTQDTLEGCDRAESRRVDERPCAMPHRSAKRLHRSVWRLRASACCEYRAFLCEVGERRPRIPPGGDVLRRLNSDVARRRRRIGPCTTAFAPERASERWPCPQLNSGFRGLARLRSTKTEVSRMVMRALLVADASALADIARAPQRTRLELTPRRAVAAVHSYPARHPLAAAPPRSRE